MTKKEAAVEIIAGLQHIHSSALGERDPLLLQTTAALADGVIPTYPWEVTDESAKHLVKSSEERRTLIDSILSSQDGVLHHSQRDRFELAFEELLTNSIYHAYRKPDGSVKYSRKDSVVLAPNEVVAVHYRKLNDGIFFSVQDQGGHFSFSEIVRCFTRCYLNGADQIETKEQGAGLGIYMVFESVAHLKIVVEEGVSTRISCWIPLKRSYSPDHFSFNFFAKGKGK